MQRTIPAPPPPPDFRPRGSASPGKTNADILRNLAMLSADIDRFAAELDHYSARCADHFAEVLGLAVAGAQSSRGKLPLPSAPLPSNASVRDWAETLKTKLAQARTAAAGPGPSLGRLDYRQHFTGLYGRSATAEDAIAYITHVRSELPGEFQKLANARRRHLVQLISAVQELI